MAQLKKNTLFSSYKVAVLFIIPVGEIDSDQHTWQLTHTFKRLGTANQLHIYAKRRWYVLKLFPSSLSIKHTRRLEKYFAFETSCCKF